MDQEFDKIVDDMDLVLVNTTTTQEHVTEIECVIRTIKESCHSTISILPYKILPKQTVIHLVYFTII